MAAHDANKTGVPGPEKPPHFWNGLSARLLVLTILFVMVAEILIFVPSIAQFRKTWLEDRLAAAQIATLVLLATDDNMVSDELRQELLRNAGAHVVALKRDEMRRLILSDDRMRMIEEEFDLRGMTAWSMIMDAFAALVEADNREILVKGAARLGGGDFIEIVIDERPLIEALRAYAVNILSLSIVISLITATLVYLALHAMLVRPLRRITTAMIDFRNDPEDAGLMIEPENRTDEVGVATRALHAMQRDIRQSLNQKRRLAELGEAVSKINHDLRNVLASLQLLSDRLAKSEDPTVRKMAPRFIKAIDRAVALTQNTLKYGRAEEAEPVLRRVALSALADEVAQTVLVQSAEGFDKGAIQFVNEVDPALEIAADPEQLFRVLTNLVRNAAQALEPMGRIGQIRIRAQDGVLCPILKQDCTMIDVIDNGPGLPPRVQETLFKAFGVSGRADGTGLGLAIANELVRGHGGQLAVLETGADGTTFRIILPERLPEAVAAQ